MSEFAATCVDCAAEGVTTKRPIVSGVRKPRCATHERDRKKKAKAQSHSRMVERTYSLTGEQYELLYSAQGGRCAICQVATGKVRRLAVEHDHRTGEVFGLACGPCNIMLGRLGRELDAYIRVINYLKDPPARRTLGPIYVPIS
jgi:hypothetical protein